MYEGMDNLSQRYSVPSTIVLIMTMKFIKVLIRVPLRYLLISNLMTRRVRGIYQGVPPLAGDSKVIRRKIRTPNPATRNCQTNKMERIIMFHGFLGRELSELMTAIFELHWSCDA